MAEPIGALRAEMSADAARFEQDMGKARRAVRQSTGAINRDFGGTAKAYDAVIGKMRAMVGVTALLVGAGALGALIKKSIDLADNIAKTADSIGISTDALQEYRFAADISGVAVADLDKALEAASKRIGEAKFNTGSLTTFLQKFDQTLLKDVQSTKTTEQALDILMRRMGQMKDQTEKLAFATNLFGRSGGRMALVAGDTAEKLAKLRQQARDLGLVIDESLLRGAESAKDALTITGYIIRTNLTKAILTLTPQIEGMARSFAELAPSIAAFIDHLSPDELKSVDALEKKLGDLQGQLDSLRTSSQQGLLGGLFSGPKMGEEVRKLEADIDRISKLLDVARQREKDRLALAKTTSEQTAKKSVDDFIESLRFQNELQLKSAREQAILINLKKVDASATDQQKDRIRQLTGALYDNAEATKRITIERKKAADEAKRLDKAHRKAIQDAQNRADQERVAATLAKEGAADLSAELDRTADAARDLSFAVGTAFEDAVIAGNDFRDVLQGILKDIERIILRFFVTQPLENILVGENGKGGLFRAIGEGIRGLFNGGGSEVGATFGMGPALQHGGPIRGPSLVGEAGPEIFVPNRPGTILPNDVLREVQAGGGNTVVVEQNFHVSPGVSEAVRRELIAMLPMFRAQAVDAVISARDRGGGAAKKLGARR